MRPSRSSQEGGSLLGWVDGETAIDLFRLGHSVYLTFVSRGALIEIDRFRKDLLEKSVS